MKAIHNTGILPFARKWLFVNPKLKELFDK